MKREQDHKINPPYGADTLRLWAAWVDYSTDVTLGSNCIANTVEVLRKFRITARFLLSNLGNFKYPANAVDTSQLLDVDHYILGRLSNLVNETNRDYENYNFSKAMHNINEFVTIELSALYIDTIKDRLYEERADSDLRRSAQTTLYHLLDTITHLLAPVLPHLADELWKNFTSHPLRKQPINSTNSITSIFQTGWPQAPDDWYNSAIQTRWSLARILKGHVSKLLDQARFDKNIRASLDACITLYLPPAIYDTIYPIHACSTFPQSNLSQLNDFLLVTSTTMLPMTDLPPTASIVGLDSLSTPSSKVPSSPLESLPFTRPSNHQSHPPPKTLLVDIKWPPTAPIPHRCGIQVTCSQLHKCARCWKRCAPEVDGLCSRCKIVLSDM